jgi:hypothetical protein
MPEVFMFVDERIERPESQVRLVVGCVVVERRRWETVHTQVRQVGRNRGKRRLDSIADLLGRAGGFALITYADLPCELVPPGELDGTDDIPRMKRADNLWSQGVLATVAAALACLRTSGVTCADIDLFYDPKSLTVAHRDAHERTLRETLPDIARVDPETHEVQALPCLTFRRVEQVPKRRGDVQADQLQDGTSLADHLCSQAAGLLGGRSVPRVVIRNHTEALHSMLSKFIEHESTA